MRRAICSRASGTASGASAFPLAGLDCPSGGVSVLSESVPIDPALRAIAERILDRVRWHGVVMLEFKITPAGAPCLIEANARFWGSLQLAIDAGVDFPYLLYQVATGQTPAASAASRPSSSPRMAHPTPGGCGGSCR